MIPKQAQVAKPLVSEVTEGKHRNLIPFKSGQSGKSSWPAKGCTEQAISEKFLAEFYNAFEATQRMKSPSSPLDALTAEELEMLGEPLVAPWLAATQRNRRSFTPAEGRYSGAHTATRPQTLLNRRTGPLIISVKLPQHAEVKAAGGHASERRADLAQAARSDSVLRLLSTGASIILDAALNRCGCHSLAGFDALKPGGLLVVADHSARPEDDATVGKTLHRIAEKTLRDEIERAGFAFVADADFLRHPEDTRTNIVFKNPTPNDEFVLKFRKP